MKKTTLLSLLFFAFLITSCNKNIKVSKQIDGIWNIDQFSVTEESNGVVTSSDTYTNFGSFYFNNDNSTGYVDSQVGYFAIDKYYLTYSGSVLNIKYNSGIDNYEYVVTGYKKKSKMKLTNESTSQGIKTTAIYTLSKN